MILALRTDSPEAELRLYDGAKQIELFTWHAHRALAETLTAQIEQLLSRHSQGLPDIDTVVVFTGPGSFTGLRIGISTANALAYALGVPVLGLDEQQWSALPELPSANDRQLLVSPVYGSEPHITLPKK